MKYISKYAVNAVRNSNETISNLISKSDYSYTDIENVAKKLVANHGNNLPMGKEGLEAAFAAVSDWRGGLFRATILMYGKLTKQVFATGYYHEGGMFSNPRVRDWNPGIENRSRIERGIFPEFSSGDGWVGSEGACNTIALVKPVDTIEVHVYFAPYLSFEKDKWCNISITANNECSDFVETIKSKKIIREITLCKSAPLLTEKITITDEGVYFVFEQQDYTSMIACPHYAAAHLYNACECTNEAKNDGEPNPYMKTEELTYAFANILTQKGINIFHVSRMVEQVELDKNKSTLLDKMDKRHKVPTKVKDGIAKIDLSYKFQETEDLPRLEKYSTYSDYFFAIFFN